MQRAMPLEYRAAAPRGRRGSPGDDAIKTVGWEYVHSIVDDCSRLPYAEIHDDERAPTVADFHPMGFEWFEGRGIALERLMMRNLVWTLYARPPGATTGSRRAPTSA